MDVVRKAPNQGWIEVITGSMFSGKSEELIRRVRRAICSRRSRRISSSLLPLNMLPTMTSIHPQFGVRTTSIYGL